MDAAGGPAGSPSDSSPLYAVTLVDGKFVRKEKEPSTFILADDISRLY